jgi:hypothetical protein
VLNGNGFPKAHEVSDGNSTDRATVDAMLDALDKRADPKASATVAVDSASPKTVDNRGTEC